jgi:hypothetical protein
MGVRLAMERAKRTPINFCLKFYTKEQTPKKITPTEAGVIFGGDFREPP